MPRSWAYDARDYPYKRKPNSWKGQKQTRTADGQQEQSPNDIFYKKNPSGERSVGRGKEGGMSWTGQRSPFREIISPQGNIRVFDEDGSSRCWDPGCRNSYSSGEVSTNPDNSDGVKGGMVRTNNCNLDNEKIAEAAGGIKGGGEFHTCGGDSDNYYAGNFAHATSGKSAIKGYHSGPGTGAVVGHSVEGNGDTTKGYRTLVSHGKITKTQLSMRGDGTTVIAVGNVKNDKGIYTLTIDPQGNMTIDTKGSVTIKSAKPHTIEAPTLNIRGYGGGSCTIKHKGNYTQEGRHKDSLGLHTACGS